MPAQLWCGWILHSIQKGIGGRGWTLKASSYLYRNAGHTGMPMGSNSASPSPPGGQALGGLPKAALHFPGPSPEFGVLLTSSWQPWTFLAQPPMHFLTLAIKLTFPGLGDAEVHIMPGIKPVLSPALLVTVNVGSEPVTGVKTAAPRKTGWAGI